MRFSSMGNGLVVTFRLFTSQFTSSTLRFSSFTNARLGGFFVMAAHLHFAEQTLALHLFLERAQCLIDVIVAYDHFYQAKYPLPNSKNVE